jgi:hypothetical protein
MYKENIRAPSTVSKRHIPARWKSVGYQLVLMEMLLPVNNAGRIKITQNDVPLAASMDEIPSNAISDEVSNPSPNKIPRGYIFQGLGHGQHMRSRPTCICDIPVNQFEHLLQDGEQWPSTLDLPSLVLLSFR